MMSTASLVSISRPSRRLANPIREMTSSPWVTCGFIAAATDRWFPVVRSIKYPTTVVVPMSKAMP